MHDVSLKRNPATGKFTFDWDADGDLKWSPYQEYSVLVTLATRKGAYFWDRTGDQGTLLYTVIKDGFATGSQLSGYAQDALDQCRAEGLIEGGSVAPTRVRTGSWDVRVKWTIAGRAAPVQTLRF